MLTKHERWLVTQGFIAGFYMADGPFIGNHEISKLADEWLNDCVADAVTVEMLLATKERDDET